MKTNAWFMMLAVAASPVHAEEAKAVFAGGCFWSMEHVFDDAPGVLRAVSGYTGGTVAHPSYEQVSEGSTGHLEAVEVTYDPAKTTYPALLDRFWRHVDPFDGKGQFCDKGPEYRSAIFAEDAPQMQAALASKAAVEHMLGKSTVTTIQSATPFYPAEEYHQRYTQKNPLQYGFYKSACGRDRRLAEIWQGH